MFTITTTIVLLVHVICETVMVAAFRIPQHNILSPSSFSYHRRQQQQQQQQRTIVCNVSNGDKDYYSNLLSTFKGDFDNYNQVIQDRIHGLEPREGGGHEHIHCTLVPCPQHHNDHQDQQQQQSQWVLAAFYFNGNLQKIFRFRMYQLIQPISNELPVRMKLNTLLPHVERQLREYSEKPCIWWKEVWKIWCKENRIDIQQQTDVKEWNKLQAEGIPTLVSSLEGCDVLWEPNWEPSKHAYLYNNEYDDDAITDIPLSTGESYHATMEAGKKGTIVDSISLIPGKRILIKDELSLWNDEFWINDRGYDPDDDSMPFVYGNQRGVPYKLQKVSNFITSHASTDIELQLQRELVNSDLEWTLGEEYIKRVVSTKDAAYRSIMT